MGLDEEFRAEYKAKLENADYISRKHYSMTFEYLSNLKTFFPNDQYVNEMAESGKDILLKFATDEINKNGILQDAIQFKILFGDFDFESQVNQDRIQSFRTDVNNWPRENFILFRHYVSQAAAIKAVLPNCFNKCALPPNLWQGAAEELGKIREEKLGRRSRGGHTKAFFNLANFGLNTQILYAKEIKFSNRGMELIMPNSQIALENVLPLPEARRF